MTTLFSNHRRKFASLTLILGVGLLAVGFVRLPDYTVPMLQGDYAAAATSKYEERFDKNVRQSKNPMLGEPTLEDKFWAGVFDYSAWSIDAATGDRGAARFNLGLSLYRKTDFTESINAMRKAYSGCCDKNGVVKPEYRRRAADIQALIGNAYANSQKTDEAIAAYELSLTLNPWNVTVIYNMERLKDANGGKGGGDGDKDKKPAGTDRTKI